MDLDPENATYPADCLRHVDLLPELRRLVLSARAQGCDLVEYLLEMAVLSMIETRAMQDYLENRESERPRSTSAIKTDVGSKHSTAVIPSVSDRRT